MKKFELDKKLTSVSTVTYHAGALGTPDNSVESVKKALECKAQVIEVDVSFRPDGTPVMIHKDKPAETEGVLLEETLKLIGKAAKTMINLDLKSTANLPAVDALIEKYGLSARAFYTGVFESWCETVDKNSAIPYYLNYSPSTAEKRNPQLVINKIRACGAIGLNSNYHYVSAHLVETLRKNGIPVSVWTLNNLHTIRKFKKINPANMTSRRPDKF